MRAKHKVGGTNEVADIFNEKEVDFCEVDFFHAFLEHDGVEMTHAAGINLDGDFCAGFGGAVGVNAGGDITVYDGNAVTLGEFGQSLLNERGFARAGGCHQVDSEYAMLIKASAVFFGEGFVCAENFFYYGDFFCHGF
jgi:hypothetical protein